MTSYLLIGWLHLPMCTYVYIATSLNKYLFIIHCSCTYISIQAENVSFKGSDYVPFRKETILIFISFIEIGANFWLENKTSHKVQRYLTHIM
jgi:hypothetical protein